VKLRYFIPFIDSTVQDWAFEARILRWLTFLWLFIGLVALFSASYAVASTEAGSGIYYFRNQLIWIAVGLVGFSVVVHSPIDRLLRVADWFMLMSLGLIMLTLVPGVGATVNGATRWLALGPVAIQPSELIKPFLVLQSARVFGNWYRLNWSIRLTWVSIFTLVVGCILLQPNLSTAALCGLLVWLMALAAGLPFSYLTGAAGAGLVLAVVSVSFKSYQRRRIISFLNPWADPTQDGYQLIQSLLAIGSGGFFGSGFGLSTQKLFYLPIQTTDFIFSVYAEEFGFLGSLVLLGLLGTYATFGFRVAIKTRNPVHRLVAIGTVILLIGQSILNIGVATGVLPTTGLPLPMVSYGGSSMLASLFAAGLLVRIARESNEAEVIAIGTSNGSALGSQERSPLTKRSGNVVRLED
jgi:cell division protein FtsW